METQHKNRKKQNIEIERQKKRKRIMQTILSAAVIFVIVAAIGFVVWDTQSRSWIMTFDGERIATTDFQFMMAQFAMFGDFEGAREMAFEELLNTVTILNRGEHHGVGLTADEIEEIAVSAEMQLQWMGINYISPHRVAEFFGMGDVRERLMQIYVPDYTPDPTLFAVALAEYAEQNSEDYESFDVKFAVLPSSEEAVQVFATEADDFDDLIRQYSIYYDEEWGIQTLDARELISDSMLSAEDEMIIMNMQEGDRHIVQVNDLFLVLYMYDRSEADMAEIEATFRTNYINQRRNETFDEYVQSWRNEANYTINQRAYNAV